MNWPNVNLIINKKNLGTIDPAKKPEGGGNKFTIYSQGIVFYLPYEQIDSFWKQLNDKNIDFIIINNN